MSDSGSRGVEIHRPLRGDCAGGGSSSRSGGSSGSGRGGYTVLTCTVLICIVLTRTVLICTVVTHIILSCCMEYSENSFN